MGLVCCLFVDGVFVLSLTHCEHLLLLFLKTRSEHEKIHVREILHQFCHFLHEGAHQQKMQKTDFTEQQDGLRTSNSRKKGGRQK